MLSRKRVSFFINVIIHYKNKNDYNTNQIFLLTLYFLSSCYANRLQELRKLKDNKTYS